MRCHKISALACAAIAGLASIGQAQTVEFARATLQGTGATSGSGISCTDFFYSGWRFEVTGGPYESREIGGHFQQGSGTIFGAIVRLSGPNDSPDSFDLTGSDVIGTTLIPLPSSGGSQEARGTINVPLENGWYAVLFGGGRFGATSNSGGLMGQNPSSAIGGVQNNVTYRQNGHPAGPGGPFLQATVARVFLTADPAGQCAADFNGDTVVDFFDYLDFVAEFAASGPNADFNADTVVDFFDYLDFVAEFAAGC